LARIYNLYIVFKHNWVIILFHLIGFLALVKFEQGVDIVRSLSLSEPGIIRQQTVWVIIAVFWWSWQSWRASRVTLHLTHFQFKHINKDYALRAQVIIPRILGIIPSVIMVYALFNATKNWQNPLLYVFLSYGLWFYIFLHYRKDLILFIIRANKLKIPFMDDYTLIKNESYPIKFMWKKQQFWIIIRLILISLFFILIILNPVNLPQSIGSAAIVILSIGSWLVIAIFINFAQRYLLFPISLTVVLFLVVFSFYNNNHAIRTLAPLPKKLDNTEQHFVDWYKYRSNGIDTVPVFLIAAEGGGIRSALWTSSVLAHITDEYPGFDRYIYHYSSVSGGSLGVASYLAFRGEKNIQSKIKEVLKNDFLSPVTAGLVIPDLFQKFIPFPINSFDRAQYLERSWEVATQNANSSFFKQGFIQTLGNDSFIVVFNATKAESGKKVLLSNIDLDKNHFSDDIQFFKMQNKDIRISTAVGVSSRFPFLTPPGNIERDSDSKIVHLVDGGYSENSGGETMLKMYNSLNEIKEKYQMKVKFNLLFIKNTAGPKESKIKSFHEVLAPFMAFSKVWINSSIYTDHYLNQNYLNRGDQTHFIQLQRNEEEILPLGWYLSPSAFQGIIGQIPTETSDFKFFLNQNLPR
jgi:hypothetical protein